MMNEDPVMVCMRADAPLTVAGSTFDKHCEQCGTRVMMAPSGQAFFRTNPMARIICYECFTVTPLLDDEILGIVPSPTQLAAEMKTVRPNPYRNRN